MATAAARFFQQQLEQPLLALDARERGRVPIADAQDRSGPIADVKRAVRRKRDTGGEVEPVDDDLVPVHRVYVTPAACSLKTRHRLPFSCPATVGQLNRRNLSTLLRLARLQRATLRTGFAGVPV
mgnify:CR=1 FL=1